MCTAATYRTKDFYFGRTLDYEMGFGEEVVITPRKYPFRFRHREELTTHYAMIGMAWVTQGVPLYYDGVNEKGLGMAGLNFAESAYYPAPAGDGKDVAQFELIPLILGTCATVAQARECLESLRVVDTLFSPQVPSASLHWMVADRTGAIVAEQTRSGMRVYDNPAGVLANEPPFEVQMQRLNDYMALSPRQPENRFCPGVPLHTYSRGMGGLGLPGDLSSASRFVRAAYVRANSLSGEGEAESVSQFFHILGAVDQQRGCCEVAPGQYEITRYTACCNADKGIYYYTTYDGHQISAVDMCRETLDGGALFRYPMVTEEQIHFQN